MKKTAGLDPVKITELLRSGALAIKPEEIGLCAADCPTVWGMVMELGYPEVALSLVVLIDGSVSVYLSNGEGVIGCGLQPNVREAAQRLLQLAPHVMDVCHTAHRFPLPAPGSAQFFFLTRDGVTTTLAQVAQLDDGAVKLAELYYAGYGLIELIELLGAGVDIADEMRLAECKLAQGAAPNTDVSGAATDLKPRGRACRILPYAGNAARRWWT